MVKYPATPNDGWQEETYTIWNPTSGDELIGTYQGSHEVQPSDGMPPFTAHCIVTATQRFEVAGAKMDKAFEKMSVGTLVKVIYDGMVDLENGRRMHDYRVYTKKA